jgi:ABC-type bacteriocin/lantibiotic exporter with double-glycine peptidase domain
MDKPKESKKESKLGIELSLVKKFISMLVPFLWSDKDSIKVLIISSLLITLEVIAVTFVPWMFGKLIEVYDKIDLIYIAILVACLIITLILEKNLKILRNLFFFKIINKAIKHIRLDLILHLHKIPIDKWHEYSVSEILSITNRISTTIRNFFTISFFNVISAVLQIISLSIAMVKVCKLSIYLILTYLLSYLLFYLDIRRFVRHRYQAWENSDKVIKSMSESLSSTKMHKFHLNQEGERLNNFFEKESQNWLKDYGYSSVIKVNQSILFFFASGLFLFYLLIMLRKKSLTIAEFTMVKGYILALYYKIYNISNGLKLLVSSSADIKKAIDILDISDEEGVRKIDSFTVANSEPIIRLDHVTFFYGTKKILADTSLEINSGDKIAIWGKSGSGKTTLCNIIAGLSKPAYGEVFFYGLPMSKIKLATIGENICLLSQDTSFINSSLIKEKHKQVSELSAGERQKILIESYLTHRPKLMILDETLSNIDEQSAHTILNSVFEQASATLIVTHRKSLLAQFTKIYSLNDGILSRVSLNSI